MEFPFNPLTGGGPVFTGAAPDMTETEPMNNPGLVIDGTPMRVVTIGFAAAAAIVALKWAGFKFNVGVS